MHAEVWSDITALVRAALQSGAPYGQASQRRQASSRTLRPALPALTTPIRLQPAIRATIEQHLGPDWLDALARGERFLHAAHQVWAQPQIKKSMRRRDASRGEALREEILENQDRFDFAFVAVQILAHERIPLIGEDDLIDDLTYPPQTLLLASCEAAALMGGAPFFWLEHLYALDALGKKRDALGLLLEGVSRTPRTDVPSLLKQIDLQRLSTVSLQGVSSVASETMGDSPSAKETLNKARELLVQCYRD